MFIPPKVRTIETHHPSTAQKTKAHTCPVHKLADPFPEIVPHKTDDSNNSRRRRKRYLVRYPKPICPSLIPTTHRILPFGMFRMIDLLVGTKQVAAAAAVHPFVFHPCRIKDDTGLRIGNMIVLIYKNHGKTTSLEKRLILRNI